MRKLFLVLAALTQNIKGQGCRLLNDDVTELYLSQTTGPGFLKIRHVVPELKMEGVCGFEDLHEPLNYYDEFLGCFCPISYSSTDPTKQNSYLLSVSGKNINQTTEDCISSFLDKNCSNFYQELSLDIGAFAKFAAIVFVVFMIVVALIVKAPSLYHRARTAVRDFLSSSLFSPLPSPTDSPVEITLLPPENELSAEDRGGPAAEDTSLEENDEGARLRSPR